MPRGIVLCPCRNLVSGAKIDAIRNLILSPPPSTLEHLDLGPEEYQLLMPSAIASLSGSHRALHQTPREDFVRQVLRGLESANLIEGFHDNTRSRGRFDFSVRTLGERTVAFDSKGGEGNSITISARPLDCHEFGIWSHFTGSLAKPPGVQARAVASRMLKVMLNKQEQTKRYDWLIVWDNLCGSDVRPCPEAQGAVYPCVILFPQVQPTKSSPHPQLHDLGSVELPSLIFDYLGLREEQRGEHAWQCEIELERRGTSWYRKARFIRLKDGSVQELRPELCTPDDAPAPTP